MRGGAGEAGEVSLGHTFCQDSLQNRRTDAVSLYLFLGTIQARGENSKTH